MFNAKKGTHVQTWIRNEGGGHMTFQMKKYRLNPENSIINALLKGREKVLAASAQS